MAQLQELTCAGFGLTQQPHHTELLRSLQSTTRYVRQCTTSMAFQYMALCSTFSKYTAMTCQANSNLYSSTLELSCSIWICCNYV